MTRPRSPQPPSSRGGIELNIEELVIQGVAPGQQDRLRAEVQEELYRLLAENGLPAPAGGYPATPKSPAGRSDSVAGQIARNIYQGLASNGYTAASGGIQS